MKTADVLAELGLNRNAFIKLATENEVNPVTPGRRGVSAIWDKADVKKLKKVLTKTPAKKSKKSEEAE